MTIFNNFTLLTFLSSLMKIIPFLVVILSTSILFSQTKKNNSVEITKFNHSFVDEYIWLEDVNSNSTAEWIENQNNSSKEVINKTVKKHDFLFKIKDYDYLSTNSLPLKIGKFYYSKYRLHKNKPSVLHFRENLNDSPKELVDPYRVYKSEDVLLLGYYPSRNSKFLAYEVSKDGSDKHEIRFVDIAKQEYLADVLTDIKFSNIAWKYDEGIFYKKNTYELIEFDTFWLSETPYEVSKGWDAALNRICTFGLFKNKETKQFFWVFNTHFDHVGEIARAKSAQLIHEKVSQVNTKDYLVVIMGDFNLEPNSQPILFLSNQYVHSKRGSKLIYNSGGTFNGFDFHKAISNDKEIDHIFVSKKSFEVKKYAVLTDSYSCKYPSDHFPVFVELEFLK